MFIVYEHDTSLKKDDKPVAMFFNEQDATKYAKDYQNKFPMESPTIVCVYKEPD